MHVLATDTNVILRERRLPIERRIRCSYNKQITWYQVRTRQDERKVQFSSPSRLYPYIMILCCLSRLRTRGALTTTRPHGLSSKVLQVPLSSSTMRRMNPRRRKTRRRSQTRSQRRTFSQRGPDEMQVSVCASWWLWSDTYRGGVHRYRRERVLSRWCQTSLVRGLVCNPLVFGRLLTRFVFLQQRLVKCGPG